MSLTFGSLFAGIGGFDLGLERAGMRCEWQVEIDDYCRRVLAKHWPEVRRYKDVREWKPRSGGDRVDVIAGGFPCQDLSTAGKQKGLSAERSGLWFEFRRIVSALAPSWVVVENVYNAWRKWLPFVRRDLWERGYATLPLRLRAQDFGAWHRRSRGFVVAHTDSSKLRPELWRCKPRKGEAFARNTRAPRVAADAVRDGREKRTERPTQQEGWKASTDGAPVRWPSEPAVGRVVHGLPGRVDRIRGLGNAVVPQVAEWIGRRIVEVSA